MQTKEWRIDAPFQKSSESDDGTLYIEGYASTFAEDRDGEIVDKSAFDDTLEEYMLNPVILLDHTNKSSAVVGKAVDAKVDNIGLYIRAAIPNIKSDPVIQSTREKVKAGLLRAFSIAGMFQYDYPLIKKVRLHEISIVPVPANQYSLFTVAKSLDLGKTKAASGSTDLPLADRSVDWDGDAARRELAKWASSDGSGDKDKVDWSKYARGFFYVDSSRREDFGGYKLPFARPINGKLTAIPKGIFAAAAAIQGARGGVSIPESDLPAVKSRIAAYYRRLGETPPWEQKSAEGLVVGGETAPESGENRLDNPGDGGPSNASDSGKESRSMPLDVFITQTVEELAKLNQVLKEDY